MRTYNERNPRLTLDDVLELEPCWPTSRLKYIARGRKHARLTTLLRDTRIPQTEREWLAMKVVVGQSSRELYSAYLAAWPRFNDNTRDAFPRYFDRRMAFFHRFCRGEL